MLPLKIFLSSPGDVAEERDAARSLVAELNHSPLKNASIELVSYDDPHSPAPMDATCTPQDSVCRYKALPRDCDLTVVILWSRIGTPLPAETVRADGSTYQSGMVWEYEDARDAGKPVWIYRRSEERLVSTKAPDFHAHGEQQQKVEAFLTGFTNPDGSLSAGINSYVGAADFSPLLRKHLEAEIAKRLDTPEDAFIRHDALTAQAVFGIHTASRYNNDSRKYYWPRPHDATLDELLLNGKNVLIFGAPLAGKTRSVWEALRRLGQTTPYHFQRFEMPSTGLPVVAKMPSRAVIFFDDIDESVLAMERREEGFSCHYLGELLRGGAQIVATCRYGIEYLQLTAQSSWNRIDELFERAAITPLSNSELAGLEQTWQANTGSPLDPQGFDHTIGSLFLQVTGMKARWASLAVDAAKHADHHGATFDCRLPRFILQALYILLRSLKAEAGVLFDPEDARDYLRRRLAATNPSLAGWDDALAFLLPGKTSQGFVRRQDKRLYCEAVYLEEIVGADDWAQNLPGIQAHLESLYTADELKQRGFIFDVLSFYKEVNRPPTPKPDTDIDRIVERLLHSELRRDLYAWNMLMYQVANSDKARSVLAALARAGVKPDGFTYCTLLTKAADLAQARAVFDEMCSAGVKPNVVTYSTLLAKAADYPQARAIFEEMSGAGVKPNGVTFNTLLDKAANYPEARLVFEEMRSAGVKPDDVTYNTLLDKAADCPQARALFDGMRSAGVIPNEVTYSILLTKAEDYPQARAVFEEMRGARVQPDKFAFGTLLAKAADFPTAHAVFEEMRVAGVIPDEVAYSTLLTKAADYPQACAVFEEMRNTGVMPDEVAYSTLLAKAPDYQQARTAFKEMRSAGVKPNEVTYSTLLAKAADYPQARAVFDEMRSAGVKPNVVTYSTLLAKAADYPQARAIFEEMESTGLIANQVVFGALIAKASYFPEVENIFNQMAERKLRPDVMDFTNAIKLTRNIETALKWFERMRKEGVKPDTIIYNVIIDRCRNSSEAYLVFEDLIQAKLRPDIYTYSALVRKLETFRDAIALLDELTAKKIRLNGKFFSGLFTTVGNLAEAREALNRLKQAGIRFDRFHYGELRKKPFFRDGEAADWLRALSYEIR